LCNPNILQPDGTCRYAPVTCDDKNKCTNDVCDPTDGQCTYTLISCTQDPCKNPAYCDADSGKCVATDIDCNDNNLCTVDSLSCGAGLNATCLHTVANGTCDDNNVCTNDFCNSTSKADSDKCYHTDIPCPAPTACQKSVGCDAQGGCQYVPLNCTEGNSDFCKIPKCDDIAGCIFENRVCLVDDGNCFTGVCNSAIGKCTKVKVDNFNSATSNNGVLCTLRYDTRAKAIAIGAGSAVGIAVGAACAIGLLGYGGKKGYEFYKFKQGLMEQSVQDNPLYEGDGMHFENPFYESQDPISA
jgi:hypothetical protein